MNVSRSVEIAVTVSSIVMFVSTLVAIPVYLVRISPDHFAREAPRRSIVVRVLRTALGIALVALGLLMLVLPGQGLLTVLVGLGVLDLPIKRRAIRRILANGKVRESINRLRSKHGKPPLRIPETHEARAHYA